MVAMATMTNITCRHWLLLGVLIAVTLRTLGQTCSGRQNARDETIANDHTPWINPLLNKTAQPPDGIGFLGRGFDIYRGNLFSADGNIGFRLPVVKLAYQKNKRTPDNAYLIPDNSDLLQMAQSSANGTSRISEIRTPPDFLRMINEKVKVSGQSSLADGRFQASKAYQELLLAAGKETFYYKIEELPLYLASLEGNAQKATPSFVEVFNQLPRECTPETRPIYMEFLSTYGTHIAKQVTLGQLFVQRKQADTYEIIQSRIRGQRVQDVFESVARENQETPTWADLKKRVLPISIHLVPLHTYITSSFLGTKPVTDIASRRDCLEKSITQYCQATTRQLCRDDESIASLRYGDEIELSTPDNKALFVGKELISIGGGILGLPLVLRNAKANLQTSLTIVPTHGQSTRLGDPVMYGDMFSLTSIQTPDHKMKLSWQHSSINHFTIEGAPQFYDTTPELSRYGPQLFIDYAKERAFDIIFTTSEDGPTVITDVGPWSLTLETSTLSKTFLVDPCATYCLPGYTVMTTVMMPSDSRDIQRITLKPLPTWSGVSLRPGKWLVTSLTVRELRSNDTYTIDPFQISTDLTGCSQCTVGEWSIQDGISTTRQNMSGRVELHPANAEFYFTRSDSLSYASMVVSNMSNVILHIRGIINAEKTTVSCSDMPCQHNGECVLDRGGSGLCRCTVDWTGSTCETPCMSEIVGVQKDSSVGLRGVSPIVFGSSGHYSNESFEWNFDFSQDDNFVIIPLDGVYKLSAIQIPQSVNINEIQFEVLDLEETPLWVPLNTQAKLAHANVYYLSVRNTASVITNKLKIIYQGKSLALNGLIIYGCNGKTDHKHLPYILPSEPLTMINRQKEVFQNTLDDYTGSDNPRLLISEKLQFVISINGSVFCRTESDSVRWVIARQLNICPTSISLNKIQIESDLINTKTVLLELSLSGEQDTILQAKTLADVLIDSGKMTLDCTPKEFNTVVFEGLFSTMEIKLIIVMAVLILLVLICIVLLIVVLVKLSHKYRDIHNELTTIRKLKMQKRIAKRQELQPQVPYHSFTLPRPNSAGSSSATTSIPGRNGQTRPLRYSQSLHGQNDRSRATALNTIAGRGSIDPTNYIISNPAPVVRTPSPGGTKSGEDSDTVQSLC